MCDSFATPWTTALQAPLSMGFLRQEYWSGLPIPSPGNIPNPKTEPESPAWQTDSLPLSHGGSPFEYACALSLKIQNLGISLVIQWL